MPVWFLWDGDESVVVYSQPGARVRNLESNPHVTLNFAGDGRRRRHRGPVRNGDIGPGGPGRGPGRGYVGKYDEHIARIGHTPESFAERYSVPVRIRLERLRGH